MVPNGTRARHGKGFLHEIDHRTPTYNVHLDEYVSIGWMVPWKDQAETNAGLKREFSLAIVNQASLWCFDMWGGVFATPETMALVARGKQLWDQFGRLPLRSRAEVALVVDPHSARYLNDLHPDVSKIYQGTRNQLNRLGAPFEVYSLNDLPHVDLERIRLVVIPGLFVITPEKRALLERHLFTRDRTVLFAYAPGIVRGNKLDPEGVRELAGTAFGTPGVSGLPREGWKSVYVPRYEDITPAMLRQLAQGAGVALYSEDAVPVFANERLVAIHFAQGGRKTITLPGDFRHVKELFRGRQIPVEHRRFAYEFESPDTALFELVP